MAISYTTNLALAKPDQGEPGPWAATVNANYDTIDAHFVFADLANSAPLSTILRTYSKNVLLTKKSGEEKVELASAGADELAAAIVIDGRMRAVTSTIETSTITGSAGTIYIFADASASATTFTLAFSSSATPGTNQRGIGELEWTGSAIIDGTILNYELGNNGKGMGFSAQTEKTISVGVITVGTDAFMQHDVDTEADAASDDLTTINGGTPGNLLILKAENAARVVTVKKGTSLKMPGDFLLNNAYDSIIFICTASNEWAELSRSSNS